MLEIFGGMAPLAPHGYAYGQECCSVFLNELSCPVFSNMQLPFWLQSDASSSSDSWIYSLQ